MAEHHVELVVRRPGAPDRRIVLQPGVMTLGRADDNDIVLSDIGVSRRHAKLHVGDNNVDFEDNGSGNGSLYNGRRFKRQRLNDGDEVVIDPFRLQFLLAAHTDEANLSTAATLKLGGIDEAMGRLELVSNHRMSRTVFEIPAEGTITLGRGDRNEVVLPEPASSRVHCELVGHFGNFTVRDRASANGTFVNGRKIREQVLRDGDKLRVGTVEFKFYAPGGEGTANFAGSQPEPAPKAVAPVTLPPSPASERPAPQAVRPISPVGSRPTVVHAPKKGAFENPVVVAGVLVGGLSIIGLVLSVGIVISAVVYKNMQTNAAAAPAVTAPPAVTARPVAASPTEGRGLSPEAAGQVQTLLAGGQKLQSEGKHFDAAAQFYKVLQLDPGNPVAERLGYRACADISFAHLRATLPAAPAAAEPVREVVREERAPQATRIAPVATSSRPTERSSAPDLSVPYAKAKASLDGGDYATATKQFQQVMAMDPERVTPEYYQAEAGLRQAKAAVKEAGNKHYSAAMTALAAKQYPTARQQLELAVAADPSNSAAKAKLEEVREELGAQAQDLYKEARIQEDIDKTKEAIRMYKQVVALVGEKDELGAKAKRRMEALQGQ